jgi:wyosine [tRNA(Phe)-imidazoG37] synthetase (radical SAM superfamily)
VTRFTKRWAICRQRRPPDAETINRAYQIFIEKIDQVEYLIGYEGNAFACTADVMEDLLAITAVHPMRRDAVDEFLTRAGADWSVVPALMAQGELAQTEYGGRTFFMLPPRGAIPGQRQR